MIYADHSRILRWLRPVTATSAAVGRSRAAARETARLARAGRVAARDWTDRADHQLRATAPPFAFADLAPGMATSRVVAAARRITAAVARTWRRSVLVGIAGGYGRRLAAAWNPAAVVPAAWLVIVAMATHIALWYFADPYRFPAFAEIALPGSVLALALAALVARRALARAWQERSTR